MRTFGQLIRELRRQSGLSQKQLAVELERDEATVARAEQDRGRWSQDTCQRALRAFAGKGVVFSQDLLHEYCELCGVSFQLAQRIVTEVEEARKLAPASDPRRPVRVVPSSTEHIPLAFELDSLIAHVGAQAVADLLKAVIHSRATSGLAPNELRHVSPPVQKPGHVEQRITTYERAAPRPSAKAEKIDKRKAR